MSGSPRVVRTARLLVCALAVACSESTEPVSRLTMDLMVEQVDGPNIQLAQQGTATIECTVTLRATAYGSGSAAWTGGKLRYFVGGSGSAVDSADISAAEVRRGWGDSTIAAHATQLTRWTFEGGFPFSVQFEFAYREAGLRQSQTVTEQFSCGSNDPTGSVTPSVQGLQVSARDGVLGPGGIVDVSFEASSGAGIWQSLVVIDGSCDVQQRFAEGLQPHVRRYTSLTIPKTCSPGGSVVVSVLVLDGAARQASITASNAIPIIDQAPPTLDPILWTPYMPGTGSPLSGTFFDGDTLEIEYAASDNHRVEWLIWEIAQFGRRDSIPVGSALLEPRVRIPLEAGWRGDFQLTLIARDSVGLDGIEQSLPGALRIEPNLSLSSRTDTIQWDIEDLEFDQRRGRLYVLQAFADQIQILAFPDLKPLGILRLSAEPHGIAITPGGDSLLVTLGQQHRTLGVIDLTQTVLQVREIQLAVDLSMSQSPFGLAALANNKVLIALFGQSGPPSNQLLEVDLATGLQRIRSDASPLGSLGSLNIVASRDGSRAAIDKGDVMLRYDAATDAFGPEVSGSFGHRISWSANGSRAAMGLSVFDGNFNHLLEAEPPLTGRAHSSALSPNGAELYHSWNYLGIMATRTSDGATIGRIRASMPIVEFLRVSPDGRHLLAAWGDGAQFSHLTVYDLP